MPSPASIALPLILASLVGGIHGTGFAQDGQAAAVSAASETPPVLAPLIREGSAVVEARGTLVEDRERSRWIFLAEAQSPEAPAAELIVHPCLLLKEMQEILAASEGHEVIFMITGEVFVYDGENYLLPAFAPKLVGNTGQSTATAPPESAAEQDQNVDQDDSDADDDVAALRQRLDDTIGDVPRSTAAPSEAISDIAEPAALAGASLPWKEGQRLIERAGRLTRDPSGAWVFVLDADAEGRADPPLIILPCMLLEVMARDAQRQLNNAPALLSGRVHLYDRRGYLLPETYRLPRFRTQLRR